MLEAAEELDFERAGGASRSVCMICGAGSFECAESHHGLLGGIAMPADDIHEIVLDSLPTAVLAFTCSRTAAGVAIYVGKANRIRDRIRSHRERWMGRPPPAARCCDEAVDVEVIVTDTEVEALTLENSLIKQNRPALQRDAAGRQELPLPEAHRG